MSGYGSYGNYGNYGSYGDFSSVGGYGSGSYDGPVGYSDASGETSVDLTYLGGTTASNGDGSYTTVTVTAPRLDLEPVIITFSPIQMGAYSEDGGSGTTSQAGNSLGVSANPTPGLTQLPANVDMAKLNSEAKYIGQVMAQMQKATHTEYGTIFYLLNGQIYYLPPIQGKDGLQADLSPLFAELPPGAEVIATEHTHPVDSDLDEREPSNADTGESTTKNDVTTFQNLEHATSIRQPDGSSVPVSVDPNLITYIVGSDHGAPIGVYAYDNHTMTTGNAGPKL